MCMHGLMGWTDLSFCLSRSEPRKCQYLYRVQVQFSQNNAALLAVIRAALADEPLAELRERKKQADGEGEFHGGGALCLPRWLLLAGPPLTHAWQRA